MSKLVQILSVTAIATVALVVGLKTTTASSEVTVVAYTMDSVHSTALFRVTHLQAGPFWGRFNDVSGTITADEALESVAFDVSIDVNSVDTNTERLDNHLKSTDFFNAREFPTMTFVSRSVERVDKDTFKVTGELTIRGITKEITADIEHTGTSNLREPRIGFEATFTINRSDFGVTYGVDNGALGDETKVVVGMEAAGASS